MTEPEEIPARYIELCDEQDKLWAQLYGCNRLTDEKARKKVLKELKRVKKELARVWKIGGAYQKILAAKKQQHRYGDLHDGLVRLGFLNRDKEKSKSIKTE